LRGRDCRDEKEEDCDERLPHLSQDHLRLLSNLSTFAVSESFRQGKNPRLKPDDNS
jgi:hypothetical protein